MSALPSAGGGYGALHLVLPGVGCNGTAVSSELLAPTAAASSVANKRKRRPAGTPDPGAEVVALSPKTLMESDRYVCEICNQGFQRDQNLQMHRRRHKVPWKLLKRPSLGTNKRVYICPERSCLHHDPAHALGDLVGIKKHYRRKHCTEKQWKCDKCSKGYAVQSDYKAHLKTCGTRGHCCDCGRVFSRVESFIEHQDTCSAVKHKPMQSGGGKVKSSSAPHHGTDRNSTGSPSQSSDTTQAMSFAHSGMSDTAARSSADEHPGRIQESQAVAATPSTPMPAWLTDHLSRHNELELLPSNHRTPMTDHPKSQASEATSFPSPESKPALNPSREPSLQLSVGPYGAEVASSSVAPHVDTKPSFRSVERILVHQRQTSGNVVIPTSSLLVPATAGKDITERGPETDHASGFLMQAVRRLGPEHHQSSTRKQQQQPHVNSRTEMVACAATGSTSSYHEDLAANMHESDAQGPAPRVMSRRGFTNSLLEPATSRQALLDHRDVAEADHLFAANSKSMEEAFRSQKHMAAGSAARAEANQAREQARTEMNAAWSDLARVRRSKDEARQECDEAQRDLARAEILKREAREQLQFAAAERAYAERAREVAKRQIEISEAELERAKRLREHAQSELDKAVSPPPAFCHSCKSALESTIPTSSPASSTWSFMTPPAGANSSNQAGMDLWPGDRLHLWPPGYRNVPTPPASSMAIGESSPSRTGFNPRTVTVGESRAQSDHNIITPKLDLDLN